MLRSRRSLRSILDAHRQLQTCNLIQALEQLIAVFIDRQSENLIVHLHLLEAPSTDKDFWTVALVLVEVQLNTSA